jgi:hypothetical protein
MIEGGLVATAMFALRFLLILAWVRFRRGIVEVQPSVTRARVRAAARERPARQVAGRATAPPACSASAQAWRRESPSISMTLTGPDSHNAELVSHAVKHATGHR